MTQLPRPSWDQFKAGLQAGLGTAVIVWGVVVTAHESPAAVPWVLGTGLGLLGLTFSIPWERHKDDEP